MIVYTQNITSRLKYIVDFIGSQVSVDGIHLTTDIDSFRKAEGPKINYSAAQITKEELWLSPHSLLFETGIHQQSTGTFEWKESKAFFKTNGDFPFDIFAASFYLLSRYEEYLPHEKDEYGRYAHQNALAFREKFIHFPLVNFWIRELAAVTGSKIQSAFQFIPTYDIDEGYCYLNKSWWRTMGGYVRSALQGNWKEFSERRKVLGGKIPDPYDSYDWIRNLHQEKMKDLETHVFFLVAEKKGKWDKNISPFKHKWREKARDFMSSSAFQAGIHPSWQSGDDPSLLRKELEILEQLLRVTAKGSRQHYIRFNLPLTYRQLIDAGITCDFSMGYGSINGFRASVASPFYWYDLEKETKTDLLLYPFCFMDANSFYEQRLTPAQAAKELVHYHYVVQLVNGTLVTIWHNTFLGTHERFKGWRNVYEDFFP
ncbi:MAG TPA: polysaccharide deacetylase family protein [Chitinophagaceae bacterium]|nr:polysaccharide deacetylase family protein [Chitinophagaceae bacterium]